MRTRKHIARFPLPNQGLSWRHPMLHVRALTRPGLEPLDFDLADGEALAVLGPSGSGKTLLLRAIADLDPNEGQVSLDGISRESMPAPAWRRQVTYLPAEPGWWSDRVVDHFPEPEVARALFPPLMLPATMMERPVIELSTGERHRIALARVLVQSPKVLLLDEPTSGLDQGSTRAVEALLRERMSAGAALLFTTHDEDLARRLGDRQLRVRKGHVELSTP
ncbi:MAG: ABC transporter ATP-binding protein [Alphaproteobacteria bacterium]